MQLECPGGTAGSPACKGARPHKWRFPAWANTAHLAEITMRYQNISIVSVAGKINHHSGGLSEAGTDIKDLRRIFGFNEVTLEVGEEPGRRANIKELEVTEGDWSARYIGTGVDVIGKSSEKPVEPHEAVVIDRGGENAIMIYDHP